jgi:hypothetical protein
MHDVAAWSFISPVPFNMYIKKHDAHITYWNGVAMTQTYARMIVGTLWLNIYYAETTKISAFREYNKIYRAGVFNTRSWDYIIDEKSSDNMVNMFIKFINKKDASFFLKLIEKYSPQETLEWFLPSKEYVC